MSVINIYLSEVPPCLAIQNYINGSTQLPCVSIAQQAVGLALWSFGMVIARSCSLTAVADVLAPLMGQSYNTLRERLSDIYREADAKAGEHEPNSMLPNAGRPGWRGYSMAGCVNR